MANQMTPDELRAAAERLDREVFTQTPLTPEQFDASNLAYRALTRLADVIEYAEQVGIVRRATVLDLARGETNERETP